jgi:hypothetical protein
MRLTGLLTLRPRRERAAWVTTIGQAVGAFTATNIDGFLVLLLLVARASDRAGGLARVFLGQFLGFAGILVLSGLAALAVNGLPHEVRPWLGLPAIALGIRAALQLRRNEDDAPDAGPGVLSAATITFTKGGDNISVYVPIFAVVGLTGACTYVVLPGAARPDVRSRVVGRHQDGHRHRDAPASLRPRTVRSSRPAVRRTSTDAHRPTPCGCRWGDRCGP